MNEFRNLRALGARLRQNASRATAGGEWSIQLPEPVQRNLRWFFFDGLTASSSDAISLTYLSIYLLALGATRTQIGLMASLASLLATLLLIPGAMLADRSSSRKRVVLLSGGTVSRLTLLLFAITPFVLPGHSAVFPIIALKVLADGMGNLSLPAWTSMTADIVPLRWRGRYFGSRNLIMGASNMIFTLLGGQIITWAGEPQGFQIAFGLSFAMGLASTFSFSRLQEPPSRAAAAGPASYSLGAVFGTLKDDRNFLAYFFFTLMWNFSLTVAAPFFNLFLVEDLKVTAATIGVLSIISSLSSLPGQRIFGGAVDRLGPRRLMMITGWLIPLLPLAWSLVTATWQVAFINVVSGFIWAGFGLAQFNFLLMLAPPEQRARYTALYQISVAVSGAVGGALGGIIATAWGYQFLFALSGAGRILAMGVYSRFVSERPVVEEEEQAEVEPPSLALLPEKPLDEALVAAEAEEPPVPPEAAPRPIPQVYQVPEPGGSEQEGSEPGGEPDESADGRFP